MGILRCTLSIVAAVVMLLNSPPPCHAWSPSDVMLEFGSTYLDASGASTVHHGMDVKLAAGADVLAPCSGEVVFIGTVPAAGGGTVLAASLSTERGRVTLLPLEAARVEVGQIVREGEPIATLAASGDHSSAETHLHVGLRQGSLYRDPAVLLVAAAPGNQPSPTLDVVPSPAVSPDPSPAPSPGQPAPVVADPVGATEAAPLPQIAVTTPEPMTQARPVEGRVQVAEGVSVAEAPQVSQPGVPVEPEASSAASAAERLLDTARGSLQEPLGLASLLTVAIVCTTVLSRRIVERRMIDHESVSDRLGTLLQHMRAGDTLRGLNSCPGHDAFTVPGPPAQGR